MRIYTRRGDAGETGLFGGDRIPKDSTRVQAIGAVDETNAALGLAAALGPDDDIAEMIRTAQRGLFELGADVGVARLAEPRIAARWVAEVEAIIDRLEGEMEPLRNFILPGGSPRAAALHVARGDCRRAERALVALSAVEALPADALAYINRLSDLLFVLARAANHRAGVADPIWRGT